MLLEGKKVITVVSQKGKGTPANILLIEPGKGTGEIAGIPECRKKGMEVDLIIRKQRKLRPIEIKAAMTFTPGMKKGIQKFSRMFPDTISGAVIYSGDLETKSEKTELVNFNNIANLLR